MNTINLINNIVWTDHRSGWSDVMSALSDYQHFSGIKLDGCLDATFGYQLEQSKYSQKIPYLEDWIGFLHHPQKICPWYNQVNLSPEYVIKSTSFLDSLSYCKGIYTLSDHLASFVKKNINLDIPVISLYHPTETSALTFDFDKFINNKKLVQIGSWMRRLTSFFKLNAHSYKKFLPINKITLSYLDKEIKFLNNLTDNELDSVIVIEHLPNEVYDKLLSESIVFLDLYDSSANNAIIECIVRGTPLIVNKIPAVVEYLGENYPLYYEDIEEVEFILQDFKRIKSTHEFLNTCIDKERFTSNYFVKSFFNTPAFVNS